jgi:hypothetical protein
MQSNFNNLGYHRLVYAVLKFKFKFKNTLFCLGITYTYERQDIIQIAFKWLPGGGSAVKKGLSDLALPLHVIISIVGKISKKVNLYNHKHSSSIDIL